MWAGQRKHKKTKDFQHLEVYPTSFFSVVNDVNNPTNGSKYIRCLECTYSGYSFGGERLKLSSKEILGSIYQSPLCFSFLPKDRGCLSLAWLKKNMGSPILTTQNKSWERREVMTEWSNLTENHMLVKWAGKKPSTIVPYGSKVSAEKKQIAPKLYPQKVHSKHRILGSIRLLFSQINITHSWKLRVCSWNLMVASDTDLISVSQERYQDPIQSTYWD